MKQFSKLEIAMQDAENALERSKLFELAKPWSAAESKPAARNKRLEMAFASFWDFDRIYFTPDMYSDAYAESGAFHRQLFDISGRPGVHFVLGARKHGKTVTLKKILVWLLVTCRIDIAGTLSATLTTSWNILADIAELVKLSRIRDDFGIIIDKESADILAFHAANKYDNKKQKFCQAFSEGRSVRGAGKMFARPDFILADDVETRLSPLSEELTQARLGIIQEAASSMSERGRLVVLGNNFDERCLMNRLKISQEENLLESHWRVYLFPAWKDGGPLWPEKFPAASEAELRAMLKPASAEEWKSDYQQEPAPPDGYLFKREGIAFYDELPPDARGVVYCDPNIALKGRGDKTAIVALYYSKATQKKYVDRVILRSFSDPNKLLEAYITFAGARVFRFGFDGNVNQESVWTNNVKNFATIKGIVPPRIAYCHYRVNELAKNTSATYAAGDILFNRRISDSIEGKEFLNQLFAFSGKKSGSHDDGPDALICADQLLFESGISRFRSSGKSLITTFSELF